MKRDEILTKAADIITKDRNDSYGEPEDNFGRIAALWTAYTGKQLDELDVANMMILLKVARAKHDGGTLDCYIDIAGYAGCAGEIQGVRDDDRAERNEPVTFVW